MRRLWGSFFCLPGTDLSPKRLDEATRRRWWERLFKYSPILFVACLAVTAALTVSGILATGGLIEYAFAGLLLVKLRLRPLGQLPFPPSNWRFIFYIVFFGGPNHHFVRLPKPSGMWMATSYGMLEALCAMISIFTVFFLSFWLFREPFWQFVTGEKWLEKPSHPNLQAAVQLDPSSAAGVAPALPYNY